MRTECPHCGQRYDLEDSFIGVEVICENCNKNFVVSAPAAAPDAPSLEQAPAAASQESRCPFCGSEVNVGVKKCRYCGEWLERSAMPKNPVIYVILALTLGGWGVHNFYSGARNRGVLKLLLSLGLVFPIVICAALCFFFFSESSRGEAFATVMMIGSSILALAALMVAICNIREMVNCHSECAKEADTRLLPTVYFLSAICMGWCGLHNFYSHAVRKGILKVIATSGFSLLITTVVLIGNSVARWRSQRYGYAWEEAEKMDALLLFAGIAVGLYVVAIFAWVVVEIVNFRKELAASNEE